MESFHFPTDNFGVDLATGFVNLRFPMRSKAGKIAFSSAFAGTSAMWPIKKTDGSGRYQWYPNLVGTLNQGFFYTDPSEVQLSTSSLKAGDCWAESSPVAYDLTGATHPFNFAWVTGADNCATSNSGVATDGSGYTLVVTSGQPILYDKSGNSFPGTCVGAVCSLSHVMHDPDGATVTDAIVTDLTVTDSLGQQVLYGTPASGVNNWGQFSYTDGSGNTQYYTLGYTTLPLATNFQCSNAGFGGAIYEYTGSEAMLTSISTPTGEYTIAYEPTPDESGNYTGRIAEITLPAGGSISYEYSGGNNGMNCASFVVPQIVVTVNDAHGNNSPWTYVNSNNGSSENFTVTETDPAGDTITHYFSGEYETERVVTDVNLGTLSTTVTCYNGVNSSKSACASRSSVPTLPITEQDVYTYLGASTAPSLVTTTFDSYGNVTKISRYTSNNSGAAYPPSSNTPFSITSISYGTGGNCTAIGNYIYDKPCVVQTANSSSNLSWVNYTYSPTGHVTNSSTWASSTDYGHMSYVYNTNGTLASATETDNNITTSYAYNGTGGCDNLLPTSTTYPTVGSVQLSTSETWNCSGGVVTSSTDANGNVTHFYYADPMWRQTEVTYPDGGSTSSTYNTGSSLPWSIATTTAVSSSQNATTTNTLDGLGRTVQSTSTDPSSSTGYHYVNTAFDSIGRVHSVTNPFFTTGDATYGVTYYTYDALGRTVKVTHPDSTYASSTYTNRAVEVTDEVGIQRIYQGDGLGDTSYVCDGINANTQANGVNPSACGLDISANGFLTTYGYDARGNLTSVNYSGQMRSFAYDGLSRLTSESNPESGTTAYSYDAQHWGALYQRTDARSITTTYTYDALGRVTQKSYSDGTPAANLQYDMSSGWGGNSLQNGKGRLTYAYTNTSSSPTTGTQLGYDVMGRPTWVYECAPLTCNILASSIVYAYNYVGEPTSMLDNDPDRTLSYAYNATGQLTGITSTQPPTPMLSNILYNALGEAASETRADVGNTTNSYDNRGRLTNHAAGSSYSLALGYSSSNNVTSLTDSINGTWTYGYAAHFANRLGTASCTTNCPAGASPFSYSYDQFGNRWGTISNVGQYTFNTNNQITNNGVVYDAAGNMTADGLGNTYAYDAENRLTSMPSGSYAATYDALGNRVEQTSAGITDDYIFGLNGRILHYNASNTQRGLGEDVYAGGEHIGLYANGTTYMVHHDQVGTTRKWTEYSGGSWISQETVTNLPFGDGFTVSSGSGVSDHDFFADYIQDPDGEFKSPTRRYSAVQGRWSTPDPSGLAAVDLSNPQTWNRYAYVTNNPVSMTDPLGLDPGDGGGGDGGDGGGDNPDPSSDASYANASTCLPYQNCINWRKNAALSGVLGGNGMAYCPQCANGNAMVDASGSIWQWSPATEVGTLIDYGALSDEININDITYTASQLELVGTAPANNDSWGWTLTKSFFSGFTLFGPKNDGRPSCFGNFVKNSVANFVGVPGVDTVAGGAAAYYGLSLSQAQVIPNTRVARGGISPSQWLEADEAARLANAGKFSLAFNAVVAESQALASEVPSALSGECK
jgi:RHS repeat-associated protein